MFAYYVDLAIRSFRRNVALTALMVLAIALGIGASMTTLTVFYVLASDPIPSKSERLFHPQLDPADLAGYQEGEEPETQMTRFDAEALLREGRGTRQALMTRGSVGIEPERADLDPMNTTGRFTSADFFALFEVPFRFGAGWSAEEDEARAQVIVISSELNETLFGGADSVGKSLRVDQHAFRIIGVLDTWRPQPMFYDMTGSRAGDEQFYLPFWTSRALEMGTQGNMNCWDGGDDADNDPEGNTGVNAACAWLQFWVELDDSKAVEDYRAYLVNYSDAQRAAGRFQRPTNVRLRNVMQWLDFHGVVPPDVRLQTWLAFGFLLVCVVNTVGLLLAKFLRRSSEIGVRRALGASRRAIFAQCLVEAGFIGLAGGVLGLGLALLGLWAVRHQPTDYAEFAHLDPTMLVATFVLALVASVIAGLLPAWRACQITPAIQLKSQ